MARRIHLFPIEPIEERYSADWHRWWPRALERHGFEVRVYDGSRAPLCGVARGEAIKDGEFLDAVDTHHYKATQLADFLRTFRLIVEAGDAVMLLDGWNPAVTALRYVRDVTGLDFKIACLLHAGTWDGQDHLSRCGLRSWASLVEAGWLLACDRILVSTEFHRDLLARFFLNERDELLRKVVIASFPLELDELERYHTPWEERPMRVVFPHRLAPEKQPEIFDRLRWQYERTYPGDEVEWVRTQDLCVPGHAVKPILYRTLGGSRVAFSAALQETWGIVQLEAWYLGAAPVVPDRLSYRELYPDGSRYQDLSEAAAMVYRGLHGSKPLPFAPARDPRDAWGRICRELEAL